MTDYNKNFSNRENVTRKIASPPLGSSGSSSSLLMSIGFESVRGELFGSNDQTHLDILNQAITCLAERNAETMASTKSWEKKCHNKQSKSGSTQ
jgi:hypothetical protein